MVRNKNSSMRLWMLNSNGANQRFWILVTSFTCNVCPSVHWTASPNRPILTGALISLLCNSTHMGVKSLNKNCFQGVILSGEYFTCEWYRSNDNIGLLAKFGSYNVIPRPRKRRNLLTPSWWFRNKCRRRSCTQKPENRPLASTDRADIRKIYHI